MLLAGHSPKYMVSNWAWWLNLHSIVPAASLKPRLPKGTMLHIHYSPLTLSMISDDCASVLDSSTQRRNAPTAFKDLCLREQGCFFSSCSVYSDNRMSLRVYQCVKNSFREAADIFLCQTDVWPLDRYMQAVFRNVFRLSKRRTNFLQYKEHEIHHNTEAFTYIFQYNHSGPFIFPTNAGGDEVASCLHTVKLIERFVVCVVLTQADNRLQFAHVLILSPWKEGHDLLITSLPSSSALIPLDRSMLRSQRNAVRVQNFSISSRFSEASSAIFSSSTWPFWLIGLLPIKY